MDAIVQMRPQFEHLNAIYQAEGEKKRTVFRAEHPDVRDVIPEVTATAVNMAVKSTEPTSEEDMYGTMKETAKILTNMRDEPWQRLAWVDQDVSFMNNHLVGTSQHYL